MSARPRRHRAWLGWSAAQLVEHHRDLGEAAPRLQWVWWGWASWAFWLSGPFPGPRTPVYRWRLRVGPLELRRWGP